MKEFHFSEWALDILTKNEKKSMRCFSLGLESILEQKQNQILNPDQTLSAQMVQLVIKK